jgi:hypothetical protein
MGSYLASNMQWIIIKHTVILSDSSDTYFQVHETGRREKKHAIISFYKSELQLQQKHINLKEGREEGNIATAIDQNFSLELNSLSPSKRIC